MGRTLLAVVGVAVAVAIAFVAPPLGLALAGALSISAAVATALVGTVLAIGLSLAFQALGVGAPSAKFATAAPQGTAVVGALGAVPGVFNAPKYQLEAQMRPVQPHWARLLWWRLYGRGRFYVIELVGDCMAPRITDAWAIVDMAAYIRRGDLFSFGVRDFRAAFNEASDVFGAVKRFIGVNFEERLLECECTKPAYVIHTGLDNLLWAHRVRATAPTNRDAKRLLKAIKRNPEAFDQPLMA